MELIERFWREGFGHLRGDDVYTVGSCAALMFVAVAVAACCEIRNYFQRKECNPSESESTRTL